MQRRLFVPLVVLVALLGGLVAPAGAQEVDCPPGQIVGADGLTCEDPPPDTGSSGNSTDGPATGDDVTDGDVTAPGGAGGDATGAGSGPGAGAVGAGNTGASAGNPTTGGGNSGPSTGGGGGPTGGEPSGGTIPNSGAGFTGGAVVPATGGGNTGAGTTASTGAEASGGGSAATGTLPATVDAAANAPGTIDGDESLRAAEAIALSAADPPDDAIEAVVVSIVDGDTIRVRITESDHEDLDKTRTIDLLGVNAPETIRRDDATACFGLEAARRIKRMLPKGRTVWLEQDVTDRDRRGRLPRYVWIEGQRDGLAYLANELLVREGYAVAAVVPPDDKLADRFADAQEVAAADLLGLWATCRDAVAVSIEPEPVSEPDAATEAAPAPEPEAEPAASAEPAAVVAATIEGPVKNCMPFATYEEAQAYYADHPEAQPNIDPDVDGLACEVRFYGGDPPADGGD